MRISVLFGHEGIKASLNGTDHDAVSRRVSLLQTGSSAYTVPMLDRLAIHHELQDFLQGAGRRLKAAGHIRLVGLHTSWLKSSCCSTLPAFTIGRATESKP